jgi:GT2 family glycosyltransferase
MSVTIIIVNWNGGTFLDECLGRLKQQSLIPTRILVMDNGSTDGSAERAQQVPGVTVRKLGANLGFAVANNRALDECDTDLVALLNPDAFPDADWLMRLVSAARAYPDIAVFGSRQMIHGLPATLDGVGDVYHISGLVWRDGYNRAQCDADDVAGEIFSPCACAALYRRDALVRAGGFDEDYFCYVEDIDLGFRLRLAGYTCLYVPDAIVHHIGSASSGGKHSDFSVYHGHRNLVWTFIKNMPGILFWALLPLHIFLNLVTVACFSVRGQGKVILRAKWDAIKGIPEMWRKRTRIQADRRATITDIWRVLDKKLTLMPNKYAQSVDRSN